MKLYSRKYRRNVERQIHFGVGRGTKTVCGRVLFSRHVLVSIFSDNDGALITDDLKRVTCKKCLATKRTRLHKLIEIENKCPGIFDRETLCGEQWLLDHALDTNQYTVDSQTLDICDGRKIIRIEAKIKSADRKFLLRGFIKD